MTKIDKQKAPWLNGAYRQESWYFSRVIRVRLELTANGLKEHCCD